MATEVALNGPEAGLTILAVNPVMSEYPKGSDTTALIYVVLPLVVLVIIDPDGYAALYISTVEIFT